MSVGLSCLVSAEGLTEQGQEVEVVGGLDQPSKGQFCDFAKISSSLT